MSLPEGIVELPPERQRMRGFQLFTKEGSCFIARFDPKYEDPEMDEVYGRLTVIGRPRTAPKELRLEGIGALPREGSRIIVGDVPERIYDMGGETVKEFPSETITRVVEFEVPKAS